MRRVRNALREIFGGPLKTRPAAVEALETRLQNLERVTTLLAKMSGGMGPRCKTCRNERRSQAEQHLLLNR